MSGLTIMSPVREYVAAHPTAKQVFAANHLNWERSLDEPLESACTKQGVDLSLLLMDLIEVTAAQHLKDSPSCSR